MLNCKLSVNQALLVASSVNNADWVLGEAAQMIDQLLEVWAETNNWPSDSVRDEYVTSALNAYSGIQRALLSPNADKDCRALLTRIIFDSDAVSIQRQDINTLGDQFEGEGPELLNLVETVYLIDEVNQTYAISMMHDLHADLFIGNNARELMSHDQLVADMDESFNS